MNESCLIRMIHSFSKVTLLLNLIYSMTIELTFENFSRSVVVGILCAHTLLHPNFVAARLNFSKVSCTVIVHCELSSKLAFENFYRTHFLHANFVAARQNFSNNSCAVIGYSTLNSKLAFENFYRMHFYTQIHVPCGRISQKTAL